MSKVVYVCGMSREKRKPDMSQIGMNPFAQGLQIKVRKKVLEVINRFGNDDRLEWTLESARFTKVFEQAGAKEVVHGLGIRAKEMYLYVMYSIDGGKDAIWIDRDAYMARMKIKSVNTFKDSVRELSNGLIIYPHVSIKDVYWINPHLFFKGDRIEKYRDRVVSVGDINKEEDV